VSVEAPDYAGWDFPAREIYTATRGVPVINLR